MMHLVLQLFSAPTFFNETGCLSIARSPEQYVKRKLTQHDGDVSVNVLLLYNSSLYREMHAKVIVLFL